jgi:hypothetical protein
VVTGIINGRWTLGETAACSNAILLYSNSRLKLAESFKMLINQSMGFPLGYSIPVSIEYTSRIRSLTGEREKVSDATKFDEPMSLMMLSLSAARWRMMPPLRQM